MIFFVKEFVFVFLDEEISCNILAFAVFKCFPKQSLLKKNNILRNFKRFSFFLLPKYNRIDQIITMNICSALINEER